MEQKRTKFNQIEAYLAGRMTTAERDDFETALQNDAELAAALTLHRELQAHLSDQAYAKVEQTIQSTAQQYRQSSKKRVATRLPFWDTRRVAAVIIFLLGLAFIFKLYLTKPLDGSSLFAQNYEVPTLLVVSRTAEASLNLSNAYAAYERKDFQTANQLFAAQAALAELPIEDQFYWGITKLSIVPPRTTEAVSLFQKIIQHGDNTYLIPAKWYEALTHLKREEFSPAKVLLQELVKTNHPKYSPASAKILKKL